MTATSNPETARPRRTGPPPHSLHVAGAILFICLILLVFWRYIFVTILPGHVGVLYSWLFGGTQVASIYGEGVAMKLPWNRIYIIETRIQTSNDEVYALSREGMGINIKISTLYSVKPEATGYLLKEAGMDYEQRLIKPMVTSTLREMISRHDSVELYTTNFRTMQLKIEEQLKTSNYSHLFTFHDIVLTELTIPTTIADAIEQKLAQEQIAASYIFRLESERQAAEQKRIRALGIQNFYSIVSEALNKNLLTWRGIEATVELAQSPNSKVIVVGGGQNQMPLILGGDISNTPQPPRVKAMTEADAPALSLDSLPALFPNAAGNSSGISRSAMGVQSEEPSSAGTAPANKQKENSKPSATTTDPRLQGTAKRDLMKSTAYRERNTEGLIQPTASTEGLVSPKPKGTVEGLRKQPLGDIGRNLPEAAPYGVQNQ